MVLGSTQKKGGSDVRFLLSVLRKVLKRLAEGGAAHGRRTRGISADHAALVSEESTLSGNALSHR
jgi:hypothetical protein